MNFEKSELHDRIEDFLDGKFSEEEKIEFLEQMKTDKELERQYCQRIELAGNWVKAKKYESAHNQVAELIREEKSQKKNRLFVWSIAASFLILVSISGIVMFTGQPDKQSSLANNSKGVETPLVPQIKQAEEKAYIHIMGTLKLIAPIKDERYNRSDSIVFKWETNAEAETYLFIGNQKEGKTIYREKIKLSDKRFILDKNFLPQGQYTWSIEGFESKEKFQVFDK
jgi:hypothetical protein